MLPSKIMIENTISSDIHLFNSHNVPLLDGTQNILRTYDVKLDIFGEKKNRFVNALDLNKCFKSTMNSLFCYLYGIVRPAIISYNILLPW